MKKSLLILLCLTFFLSGCTVRSTQKNDELNIVTSFYPIYVTTINLTKDIEGVKVTNLTSPQVGCLHDYSLLPENMKTLEKADIFVINGAGMESFFEDVVKALPKLKTIVASENIPLLKDENGEDNAHIWVSVSDYILQVENIAKKLIALDSKNAVAYEQNKNVYVDKLMALKSKMHSSLDNLKNKDIITFHEAFPYFAKEFSLNIAAVIEREPGSEPSPAELKSTIEIIKKNNIKAIFTEPQYSQKSAELITKETSLKLYTLDPFVTGEATPNAYDNYINIMEQNTKSILEALS